MTKIPRTVLEQLIRGTRRFSLAAQFVNPYHGRGLGIAIGEVRFQFGLRKAEKIFHRMATVMARLKPIIHFNKFCSPRMAISSPSMRLKRFSELAIASAALRAFSSLAPASLQRIIDLGNHRAHGR